MLYEVALIQKPTKKAAEEGEQEKLILPPTPVIAHDDKAAALKAVLDNKDKITTDLANVTVLVRPFA
jgi:hypothetical protein